MSFATSFAKQGFLVIPRLFEAAFIDRLREEYARQLKIFEAEGIERQHEVGNRRMQLSIELRGPFLDPMLWSNPLLLTIVRSLLGSDVLIDSLSVVVAFPGAEEQHHHRDHGSLFFEMPLDAKLPAHAVAVMIPLIDFDEETGTTVLDPGTHHGASIGEPYAAFVPKGGCYLMDYNLHHWGQANRSAQDRPLIAMTFARPWFIDSVNYRFNKRLNIAEADALAVPREHWPLFRRLEPSPYPAESSHKLSKEEAA